MNFVTMQQELSDRLGAYDNAVSADLTKLKRWLNMAQQQICSQMNWPFMLSHEVIQTVTDITTGTVSINSGSTTVTFSSAPSVSVADWFIKFEGTDNWYRVSSHTAATTTATLTISYGESSNLSGGTYTLRKLFYSTASPLDSILDIKKTADGFPLEAANAREADVFLPLYWDAGDVYKYISSIPDSTAGIRFSLLYSPSSVINLQVRGIKKLSDMSADADNSVIPARWHSAILELAAYYGFSALDDTRAKESYAIAQSVITDMARVYNPDLGRHRVMRSLDHGLYIDPAYVLPGNYGPIIP